MTPQDIFDALSAPFVSEQISWRVGSTNKNNRKQGEPLKGKPLAYIDARDVMDRLDAVVGPGNWQCEYVDVGNNATCCRVGIFIDGLGWVWKSDGAGQTDVEGDKGQFSDAFKRAAVRWGIGRYLYDLDSPWIELEERGGIPKASEGKLSDIHDKAAAKAGWGGNQARHVGNAIRLVDSAIRHFVHHPEHAEAFAQDNEGVLASLPKAAREHVLNNLARVGTRTAAE
jgi:hypothetical protein